MKKTVLVRGPALSQSGYGEHARFVLRALRRQEDQLDIHILPTNWGETGWIANNDEERSWLDNRINAGIDHLNKKLPYDISVQVTIPNEWQKMALINIGVTAGIECNKVSPVWLEKANIMDKIITISEHSKNGFVGTVFQGHHKDTGQPLELRCEKPVEVVGYPVKVLGEDSSIDLPLELEFDFNYLAIAQHGPRKNISNIIRWFVEENIDEEVGLIVKTSIKNNSITDREYTADSVRQILGGYPERKCKVYLLHGDMSELEMHQLYRLEKVKAFVSLSHGEGFGLPLFEAAYSGLPVIAPGWSGQCDFLYAPSNLKSKKAKNKKKAYFAEVDFDIAPVPEQAVWDGVIEKDTMWAFPKEGSYKMKLRQVRKNYDKWLAKAEYLKNWIRKEFESEKMHALLSSMIHESEPEISVALEKLPKISLITSVYDADDYIEQLMIDVTRQTIFKDKCEWVILNANPKGKDFEEKIILEYIEKYPDNIVYKRLEEDPGIYDTWNMAIRISTGEFITNINCDDRRAPDGLEKQAKLLVSNSDVDLVYNDSFLVREPNVMWEDIKPGVERYNFEQFSKEAMLRGNLPHNNPMWRREVHEKYGYFNQYYKSAGDWDFWLRCAFGGSRFKKHPETLGVYYFNPTGMSTNPEHDSWKKKHEFEIFKKYQKLYLEERL
jgi:glycosyltransferase involved in cell wall biosynthesis